MKYKNRLIIPTLLSTSLLASTMVASADEIEKEEQAYEQNLETYADVEDIEENDDQEEAAVEDEGESEETTSEEELVEEDENTDETTETEEPVVADVEATEEETLEEDTEEVVEETATEQSEDEVVEDEEVETTEDVTESAEVEETEVVEEEITEEPPSEENVQEEVTETNEVEEQEEVPEEDPATEEAVETTEDNTEDVTESTEVEETEVVEEEISEEPSSEESVQEEVTETNEVEVQEKAEEDVVNDEETTETEESDADTYKYDSETLSNELENMSGEERSAFIEENADDIEADEEMLKELSHAVEAEHGVEINENQVFSTFSTMSMSQAITDINSYIAENNFEVAEIQYDIIDHLPLYAYESNIGWNPENGKVGQPSGVVLHDVGNDNSTIHGEISYMSRNWENAFVHAFVDADNIIQIANTDYLAYGAGPVSNEIHLQVELVRHDNQHDFARSINNYADYIANLLYKYKLPAERADSSGNGTLWSHVEVSEILGGTASPDPYEYFATHGYAYEDVITLIQGRYDNLYNKVTDPSIYMPTFEGDTSNQAGSITNQNRGIYESITDVKTYDASNYLGEDVRVVRSEIYNYEEYYLLENVADGSTIGWMYAGDVVTSALPETPGDEPETPEVTPDPEPEAPEDDDNGTENSGEGTTPEQPDTGDSDDNSDDAPETEALEEDDNGTENSGEGTTPEQPETDDSGDNSDDAPETDSPEEDDNGTENSGEGTTPEQPEQDTDNDDIDKSTDDNEESNDSNDDVNEDSSTDDTESENNSDDTDSEEPSEDDDQSNDDTDEETSDQPTNEDTESDNESDQVQGREESDDSDDDDDTESEDDVSSSLEDEATGVSVHSASDELDGKQLVVTVLNPSNAIDAAHDLYDIHILDGDGSLYELNNPVTVYLPANGYVSNLYYLGDIGETLEPVSYRTEDDYVVFETSGFSQYAVVYGKSNQGNTVVPPTSQDKVESDGNANTHSKVYTEDVEQSEETEEIAVENSQTEASADDDQEAAEVLPNTGVAEQSTTIYAALLAALGLGFLVRRKKTNEDK